MEEGEAQEDKPRQQRNRKPKTKSFFIKPPISGNQTTIARWNQNSRHNRIHNRCRKNPDVKKSDYNRQQQQP